MHVGLFVRDEYERSVKNQASKVTSVDFATGSRVACEKQPAQRPRVKHMTRTLRVVPGCHFRDCLTRRANLRRTCESLCLTKSCVSLPSLYPHYIYPHYPQIVKSAFQKENPRKYTRELEIIISTIIYTFPCGFP